ncbi:recombinase family protein [Streptosporangium sp. NPDC023963]|uniref:recombinase family protein n=1 Tax=Streptosporangium sp. NPDC023963 TaxID=3155608 RepID=UPI0034158B6B
MGTFRRATRGRKRLTVGVAIKATDDQRPHSPSEALRAPESAETLPPGHLPHTGVRWTLYARSGGGGREQTAQQFAVMEDATTRLGGTIAFRFSDLGRPGTGRNELIEAARQGQADRVMVWDLHRFGRQRAGLTLTTLRDLGVGVTLAETGQDVDDVLPPTVAAMLSAAGQGPRPRRNRSRGGS